MNNVLIQIILIYGPQHILGGMVAAERENIGVAKFRKVFVFRQNWLSTANFELMVEDCQRVLELSSSEFHSVLESDWENYLSELETFVSKAREEGCEIEFLFPHDVVTNTVKAILSCTGKVYIICYGDGMGTVFSRKTITLSRLRGVRRLKQKAKFALIERDFLRKVDVFHLMLPVVESKVSGIATKLQVPDRSTIRKTIDGLCLESKDKMSEFIGSRMDSKTAVICLENLAESQFSEFEKEVQLYAYFASSLNIEITKIYLKPHPLQEMSKIGVITDAILGREVFALPDYLSRTPIEYWPLENFQGIVCSMGVPNISLRYLYNLSVVNPASDAVIRKFIDNSYHESFFWVEQQLRSIEIKLEKWDTSSILYNQQ